MGAGARAPQPCRVPPVPPAPVPQGWGVFGTDGALWVPSAGVGCWGRFALQRQLRIFFCELFLASPPLVRAVT